MKLRNPAALLSALFAATFVFPSVAPAQTKEAAGNTTFTVTAVAKKREKSRISRRITSNCFKEKSASRLATGKRATHCFWPF